MISRLAKNKKRPRLLFVAMADSIHTAKYINLLAETGWDVHLFSVYHCEPHALLRNVTVWNGVSSYRSPAQDPSVRMMGIWPFRRGRKLALLLFDTFKKFGVTRTKMLTVLMRYLRPDVVHSLEIQGAGYVVDEVRKSWKGRFPVWVATNWGSDIYVYGRLSEHEVRIRSLLAAADVYVCECVRDVALARNLGFKGRVMPVVPNPGGFDLDYCRSLQNGIPPSQRRVIVVKGYQYSFGRSLVALRALERVAHLLTGYRIVMYSPYPREVVEIPVRLAMQRSGLDIVLQYQAPHEDMMRLHGSARISISLSISDAICTSMTEAMVMGSFPIQSDGACADEWVKDGETAFLVNADDPDQVADRIAKALTDDALVDNASILNAKTAADRLDSRVIRETVVTAYHDIIRDLAFGAVR